jgi:hypothetical protein
MSSETVPRISVPRLIAEGSAIVVSILLAFSIDAWWDARQEREIVDDLLLGLLDDLQQGKENVAFRQAASEAREQSILKLLEAAADSSIHIDESEMDRLLSDTVWYFDDVPISEGAINSLVFSGMLGLVRNEKLRRDIADWPRAISYVQHQLKEDYDVYFDVWIPYLSNNGDLFQIYRTISHVPGHPEMAFPGLAVESAATVEHSSLLRDRRFRNMLVHLWDVQNNVQGAYVEIEERLDLSIRLVEEELAR